MPEPAAHGTASPRTFSILGLILDVAGLFLLSIVFGLAGVVLGQVAVRKGDRRVGLVVTIFGALDLVLGVVGGFLRSR